MEPFWDHVLVFNGLIILFSCYDVYIFKFNLIKEYKLQSTIYTIQDWFRAYTLSLINQWLVNLPMYLIYLYLHQENMNWTWISAWQILIRGLGIITTMEIFFYSFHYLFHNPRLYGKFHKLHHTFKAPFAASAQYAHPIDHLMTGMMPMFLTMYFWQMNRLETQLFMIINTFFNIASHAGMLFYNHDHDLHHKLTNVNYGALMWMDKWMGTWKS